MPVSASSQSATTLNSPGGNVSWGNNNILWIALICAALIGLWIWKKGGN